MTDKKTQQQLLLFGSLLSLMTTEYLIKPNKNEFYRWVGSHQLKALLKWEYTKVRYEYDKLVKKGLIARKRYAGGCVMYSANEFEGFTVKGDYFVKNK